MIEFGKTLRDAREAKGYSVSQLAEKTHLLHQVVEDLEAENFTRIPAPIYGRGFVKLYCEAVGIDPQPLIAEYMAIQSGDRATTIRVRAVDPAPAAPLPPAPARESAPAEAPAAPDVRPAEEPPAETAASLPPVRETLSLDDATPVYRADAPDFWSAPPPPRPAEPLQPPRRASEKLLPAARREFRLPEMNLPQIPRNTWRIVLVAGAAVLLLWGAIAGGRALYRATMTAPAEKTAAATETAGKPADRKEKPATAAEAPPAKDAPPSAAAAPRPARTPLEIPPLYID